MSETKNNNEQDDVEHIWNELRNISISPDYSDLGSRRIGRCQSVIRESGERFCEGIKIILYYSILELQLQKLDKKKYLYSKNQGNLNEDERKIYEFFEMHRLIRNAFAHGSGRVESLKNQADRSRLIKLVEDIDPAYSDKIKIVSINGVDCESDEIHTDGELFRIYIQNSKILT